VKLSREEVLLAEEQSRRGIVRKRFRYQGAGLGGKVRSGQAKPNGRTVERNVGKGRKEWRHFAEVDKRKNLIDRTKNEVTIEAGGMVAEVMNDLGCERGD
jgi:hypothetical protein